MIKKKEFINLIQEIILLKKVKRTGWVLKGIKDAESVADHSWMMSLISVILADKTKLDIEKLLKMSLIHDLGEAVIGDIRWEKGKEVIGSQEQKMLDEKREIERLFADNPNFHEFVNLWVEFTEQKTAEAKFVKIMDKLEMAIQAFDYQKEGYSKASLSEFWENAEKYLKDTEFEELFKALKKESQDIH